MYGCYSYKAKFMTKMNYTIGVLLSMLFSLGSILVGCSHGKSHSITGYCDTVLNDSLRLIVRGHFVENDTVFFLKEYLKDREGMPCNALIYLDANPDSRYRTTDYWVNRFDISDDLERWSRTWKEQHVPVGKFDLQGLPAEWIPLHYRGGKPYVCSPFQVDFPYQVRWTDSIACLRMLEPVGAPIHSFEKLSSTHYRATFNGDDFREIDIRIVDERTQAAVWNVTWKENVLSYSCLMIPVESHRYFDLIVCEAGLQVFPYKFLWMPDEIDTGALADAVSRGEKVDFYDLKPYVQKSYADSSLQGYVEDLPDVPSHAEAEYADKEYWTQLFDKDNCFEADLEKWTAEYNAGQTVWVLNKSDLLHLPADWIPLHYRNGKPYVLATDKADNPPQARLAEGVVGYKQESGFRFVPAVCYKMSFTDYRLGNLFLHFIDRHCRVAVWETARDRSYDLMIPVESACYFDVVDEAEARTFRPDAVDIKAMLEALKAGKQIDLYNLDREYAVPVVE